MATSISTTKALLYLLKIHQVLHIFQEKFINTIHNHNTLEALNKRSENILMKKIICSNKTQLIILMNQLIIILLITLKMLTEQHLPELMSYDIYIYIFPQIYLQIKLIGNKVLLQTSN